MPLAYTRRFVARYEAVAGYTTLWTPSSAYVWIIRDIVLANQGGTQQHGQVWIQAGSSAFVLLSQDIPANTAIHLEIRQEILPAEPLNGGLATGPWSIAITGYALQPPTAAGQ